MKSNEEFIAGIYEKAAVYTEEKEIKRKKADWVAKATRIAAMAAVCIGLAGVSALVLGSKNSAGPAEIPAPADENYGIALTSETGEELGGAASFRVGPVAEFVTFTGVVKSIDTEENRIWITLVFDESAPEYAENSVVCIRWDMLEEIGQEIKIGETITATGALSRYEKEASEHNGCAELIITDLANLMIR